MNIIHVMKDGTIRESVEGIVIRRKEFYEIINNIRLRRKRNEKQKNHA